MTTTALKFPYPYTLDLTPEELQQGNYYLIGDLWYLCNSSYLTTPVYTSLNVGSTYVIHKQPTLTLFSTGGDGLIEDNSGRIYTVEAGMFGCIKAEFLPKQEIIDCIKFFKDFEKRCIEKGLDDYAIGNLGHFVKVETTDVFAEIGIPEQSIWGCEVPYGLNEDGYLDPWCQNELMIGKTVDEP